MTATLYWKPKAKPSGHLTDELRRILGKRLWDTDGSCGDGERTLDGGYLLYLQGLKDSGVKGAAELIDLLNEHGEIVLWFEN